MDMDRFSERAREALETAQGIVRRGPGNQLGTEHLLIGVLSLPGGVVEQVFNLRLDFARDCRLPFLAPGQQRHECHDARLAAAFGLLAANNHLHELVTVAHRLEAVHFGEETPRVAQPGTERRKEVDVGEALDVARIRSLAEESLAHGVIIDRRISPQARGNRCAQAVQIIGMQRLRNRQRTA